MKILILFFALAVSYNAIAQTPAKKDAKTALLQMSFLVGKWKGDGWFKVANRTDSVSIEQVAAFTDSLDKLNIAVSANILARNLTVRTLIQFTFDEMTQQYRAIAFNEGGSQAAGEAILLNETAVTYTVALANGAKFKYTYTVNNSTQQVAGEMSLPGQETWVPSFFANLSK